MNALNASVLLWPCPLYAQSVEAQPVDAAVALHHAELVELLLARGGAAADVPLVGAHDFVKTLRGAV